MKHKCIITTPMLNSACLFSLNLSSADPIYFYIQKNETLPKIIIGIIYDTLKANALPSSLALLAYFKAPHERIEYLAQIPLPNVPQHKSQWQRRTQHSSQALATKTIKTHLSKLSISNSNCCCRYSTITTIMLTMIKYHKTAAKWRATIFHLFACTSNNCWQSTQKWNILMPLAIPHLPQIQCASAHIYVASVSVYKHALPWRLSKGN